MKVLITIIAVFFYSFGFAQTDMKIEKVKEIELISLLNRIELIKEFKTENLSIRVFLLGNEPCSAGFESGEITHDVYFAVSEFDEYPNQSLFRINSLYSVKIESIDSFEANSSLIEISYVENEERKILKLKLTINELKKDNR